MVIREIALFGVVVGLLICMLMGDARTAVNMAADVAMADMLRCSRIAMPSSFDTVVVGDTGDSSSLLFRNSNCADGVRCRDRILDGLGINKMGCWLAVGAKAAV